MKSTALVCILIFMLLPSGDAFSQSGYATSGTEFWLGFMRNNESSATDQLYVEISSYSSASGTIEIPGADWSVLFYVDPGSSTTINIPSGIAEMLSSQSLESKAVHITSDNDVTVIAVNNESGTTDAARILPLGALGTNYTIASYPGTDGHESELLIVATADNSSIEVIPSAVTQAGNAAGLPFTIEMDMGQCYQVYASGSGDLTGTVVRSMEASGSCRPFAVFSGAGCGNVPQGCALACDHLWEQNLPLDKWGTDYQITPPVFETDPDYGIANPRYTYRILAASNATNVVIDGVSAFSLDAGEFQEYNSQEASHCISASQPVLVIQYMEGISCGGNGDPSMMILDQSDHETNNAIFTTPSFAPSSLHYVNIVIDAASLGTALLDGNMISAGEFQVLSSCGSKLWCGLEIDPGVHTIEVPAGFTGWQYGTSGIGSGVSESYALPLKATFPELPPVIEQAFCSAGEVQLSLPAGYENPIWFDTADTTTAISTDNIFIINTPINNALYVVRATQQLSGCQEEFYYSVESPDALQIEMSPADLILCEHQNIELRAEVLANGSTYQYQWTPATSLSDATIATPIATPDETTTYTVVVSTLSGCASGTGSVTLTVNEGSIASFHVTDESITICEGEEAQLGVTAETVIWSDNFNPAISWGDWESIFGGEEGDACGTASGLSLFFNGTYPREAITQPLDLTNGGHIYFSLKVASGSAPCDNAEPGDNVVLAYSVNNGPWVNIQTYYESAYPDFTAVVADIPAGAMNANTRFRWRQVGSYTNNQDNWALDNMFIGVLDNASYSIEWTPDISLSDATSTSPIASPVEDVVYQVSMTDVSTGCTYTDSVWVDVGQSFNVAVSPDTAMCDAQGILLYAEPETAGEYSYSWSPVINVQGVFDATPLMSPVSTTTYEVTVTSSEGCEEVREVNVVVSALLDLELTASDLDMCEGDEITLNASLNGNPGEVEYLWTGDNTIVAADMPQTQVAPDGDAVYTCVVTHVESGCQVSDSLSISVTESFMVSVTPGELLSCVVAGTTIEANATTSQEVNWSWTPASMVVNADEPVTTIDENTSGALTVTATTASGCAASAVVDIQVQELTTDLGPDTGLCEGETITLDAGWPETYDILWNTSETTPTILISESGYYTVTVVSPDGCVSQDNIVVNVYSYPIIDLGPDTSLCDGAVLTLDAGIGGLNYTWNNGQHSSSISVNETGIYELIADNGYCFTSDEIGVQFYPNPVRPFSEEIPYCFAMDADGFFLDAENEGAEYQWNNDSLSRVISITQPGVYSVAVTSEHWCSSIFETEVKEDCPVSLYVPNSFTPDGDGINDVWMVYGQNIIDYHLRIYNRMGEMFYESRDITMPWLGQRHDGDFYLEPGAYDYMITYRTLNEDGATGDEQMVRGFVVMVR